MGWLPPIDILGYWLGIFLTFCILSFLYKDNPIYKVAEHLFIGVSIGYVVTKQYYDTLRPKLIDNLTGGEWAYLIGLALALALLVKAASRRYAWVGRFPIAFVVAFYAGLQINGMAQGDLGPQMAKAMDSAVVNEVDLNTAAIDDLNLLPGMTPAVSRAVIQRRAQVPFRSVDELVEMPGLTPDQRADLARERDGWLGGALIGLDAQATVQRGETYWFGTFSRVLMLLGLIASLVYFYFSVEHKGVVGKVSRFGVWVLMVGFGAAFGFTVQGRISLAIGRALDVLGRDKDPMLAEQIGGGTVAVVSIAIIVAAIVAWELWLRRRADDRTPASTGDV